MLSLRLIHHPSNPKPFAKPSLPTGFLRTLPVPTPATPLAAHSRAHGGDCLGVTASVGEIAKGIVRLQCESSADGGVCHVYLVGTCHVSQKSCQNVKAVINYVKPQFSWSLCEERVNMLTHKTLKVPTESEMLNFWEDIKGNPSDNLSCQILKMASELVVNYGAEMRVAYEEARSYGASVYLGDRPFEITSSRVWNAITVMSVLKFLDHMLFKSDAWKQIIKMEKKMNLNDVKQGDELKHILQVLKDDDKLVAAIQDLCKAFPSLMDTIIMERDKYMSSTLWNVAREHSSVVAVVGKAHLSGIKKYWMQPIEVESLLEVPSKMENFSASNIFARATAIKDFMASMYRQFEK